MSIGSRQPEARQLIDPRDPCLIANPYPTYRRLHSRGPIQMDPVRGHWVATGYEVCASILKDKRFGRRYEVMLEQRYGTSMLGETAFRMMAATMLMQELPGHTRIRGLVAKAFTARRVDLMRSRIRALVSGMLDRLEPLGRMDVIADFAHVLPVTVICDMLGIPEADRWRFFHTASAGARILDPVPMTRTEINQVNAMFDEQIAYFTDLFERRRREPGDDLITALLHGRDEAGGLTVDELHANVWFLFVAGHETTKNLIGNGLLALYRNPDQLDRLRADLALIPNAVCELLRYDPAIQIVSRTAYEDVPIGGVIIGRNQLVLCLLAAANRDPAVFLDPDRLDLGRPDIRLLSFGGGIHYCLGAHLTQIEGQEALAGILSRLPRLCLMDTEKPLWQPNFTVHGLSSLPVSW
jgi:cytochrome P450